MPKPQSPTGLDIAFEKKLAGSMLTAAEAKTLHFQLLYAEHSPEWLPAPAGGFLIPYFDLDGNETSFCRYRMLEQPKLAGFAASVERKEMRYGQEPGTLNEAYLPPLVPWREVARDAGMPVLITEGELKSACGTRHTPYPTIGLGGVWCFRSARAGFTLLPALEEFDWQDRPVYVVFDSDAVTNPDVCAAENELARQLTKRGAQVKILRIPRTNGSKVGLDDFLLYGGIIDDLVNEAEDFAAAKALHDLNEQVLYVRDPGFVLRLSNDQQLRPQDFISHAFATLTHDVIVVGPNGKNKVETRPTAKEWLKWPGRSEVERITYAPGADVVTKDGEYNVWPGWGVNPEKGDVTPWLELLDLLFGDDAETRVWFERWLAYPLQHPGAKMYSCPLIWSTNRGVGKSFVGYSMFKIYGRNAAEIQYKELHGSFTSWAANRQFIMIDDAESTEKREEHGRLRHIITRQQMTMNQKYIKEFTIPDVINYYITANAPDTLYIEDRERRYLVHEVRAQPAPRDFYQNYENWIGKPRVVGAGAAALFHHLLTLDLGEMRESDKAPETASRAEMIELGRSDIGVWCKRLIDDPDSILRVGGRIDKRKLWTSEELLCYYDPEGKKRVTANGITRELRRLGKHRLHGNMQYDTHIGRVRLWEIRSIPRDLDRTAITELYDSERGHKPQTNKAAGKSRHASDD